MRFVQVARNGPEAADGWSVLDDSTSPSKLFLEGRWKLSDELKRGGTVPQYVNRPCSIKFKGWIAQHLGGTVTERTVGGKKLNVVDVPEPFEHCLGFNADEENRSDRDSTCGGPMRRARYPLQEWGWGRQACLDYLLKKLRVEWRKSCCHVCPFTNGNAETLARFRRFPERAADALLIEHVCLALNPKGSLYRDGKTLRSCIEEDNNNAALVAFNELLRACTWAVYHVRRIYRAKGNAGRSVTKVATGDYAAMATNLVLAPATALDKTSRAGFDDAFARLVGQEGVLGRKHP